MARNVNYLLMSWLRKKKRNKKTKFYLANRFNKKNLYLINNIKIIEIPKLLK